MGFVWWLIVGLIAGALARLVVPGKDAMGLGGTLVLGLVGSVVGGVLGAVFTSSTISDFSTAGLFGSIIGAIVALLAWRWSKNR
ncbi:MAG: GlsB/YeaQ/YmgE family stress response membrane protein [Acidimicrobiia bacterium]|nr:GlsB/YeaQ/YmgE family stress response membrane protein [Acidimicrobiia bacterium]